VIDCDVHNQWPSAEVLLPYLEPPFREYLERGELPGPPGALPHAHRPWIHPEGFKRADVLAPEEGDLDAHFEALATQLLDRFDLDFAILTGEEAIEVSTLANGRFATALARAYNDWLVSEWLPRDARLRGSLVVAPQDPVGAAKEIRRLGGHEGIVQVLVSSGSERPYGDPFYGPIWDAAAEVGLPVAVHLGGQGGINANPTGCGPPTFFWEAHALFCETGMGHVASVIAHGIFERYPEMRLVLVECGVAWLPAVLWRLDSDYKALRKETPWLRRLPSEYARDHIRLTTQPLEQPPDERHLWAALEAMHGRETLLFASDYPHWDFDDPTTIRLPAGWEDDVFDGNARRLYGLPAKKPEAESATVA
jgi:predicted TIM-barrel fold metal-dependent hydrolase